MKVIKELVEGQDRVIVGGWHVAEKGKKCSGIRLEMESDEAVN